MLIIVVNVEARKMLENGDESHQSSARGVSPRHALKQFSVLLDLPHNVLNPVSKRNQ